MNEIEKRSLAILFGASEFPRYPDWNRSSFKQSVSAIEEYLLDPSGLNLRRNDILNLFDSVGDPSHQLGQIELFLSERTVGDHSAVPANLIVYYVGHGCFSADKHHCFALRSTRPFPLGASALRGGDLAEVIRQGAAHLRRFLLIDCCFAASLTSEFQAFSPGSVFEAQLDQELPSRGTALLCASSRDMPALAPQAWKYTMFGGALIEALREGDPRMGPRMSLRDVETLCRTIIRRNSPDNYTRPELHVPKADEGDIANLQVFPNPAWAAQRAAEEEKRRRDAETAESIARKQIQAKERQIEQERLAKVDEGVAILTMPTAADESQSAPVLGRPSGLLIRKLWITSVGVILLLVIIITLVRLRNLSNSRKSETTATHLSPSPSASAAVSVEADKNNRPAPNNTPTDLIEQSPYPIKYRMLFGDSIDDLCKVLFEETSKGQWKVTSEYFKNCLDNSSAGKSATAKEISRAQGWVVLGDPTSKDKSYIRLREFGDSDLFASDHINGPWETVGKSHRTSPRANSTMPQPAKK